MMADRLLISLIISLGMTLVLEAIFAAITGVRSKKEYLLVCAVNIVTNPPVVLTYWFLSNFTSFPALPAKIVLEAAAVLTEAWYYRRYSQFRRPFLFSLLANAFSFGVGAILNILLTGV